MKWSGGGDGGRATSETAYVWNTISLAGCAFGTIHSYLFSCWKKSTGGVHTAFYKFKLKYLSFNIKRGTNLSIITYYYKPTFTGDESTLLMTLIVLGPFLDIVSAIYIGLMLGHMVGWIKGEDASLITLVNAI